MAADTDHGHDDANDYPDPVGTSSSSPSQAFVLALVLRYVEAERPLSGYFLVCSLTEIQWVLLGQVLAPTAVGAGSSSIKQSIKDTEEYEEAAAANDAWSSLVRDTAVHLDLEAKGAEAALQTTLASAMKCFEDLLIQIEEMDVEPSMETYAYETMAESLKLASLCSVALRNLDNALFARLRLLLSESSPLFETLVQEAALSATTVLVHNFPDIAASLTGHLRRFVTAPLPIFEFEFASDSRAPAALTAAAKCLALCVRVAPGDDLIMSNMYSLLNYIAATSKDLTTTGMHSHAGTGAITPSLGGGGHSPYNYDHATLTSVETGLRVFNEDQRRLIGISTISVVTQLALELEVEVVTRLTVSMLLQRVRSAEPAVEAAIAYNLVDLALAAPEKVFSDIIRAFSVIERVLDPHDPRLPSNMILAAQTRLAQELGKRPELYETYLAELLNLFSDKGVAIQTRATASREQNPAPELLDELGALVLPIDALISQPGFKVPSNCSAELVTLFRNFWFICVLFRFTTDDHPAMNDWQRAALTRIASKTPPIVQESAADYVTSDLEYNPVLRQDYMHMVMRGFVAGLSTKIVDHSLSPGISTELRLILVASTHRVARTRDLAMKYLNRLMTAFPSLMCDAPLVFAILDVLTLLRKACEGEFTDEYTPQSVFTSEKTGVRLELTDNYGVRNDISATLHKNVDNWLHLAVSRAPFEVQAILQSYVTQYDSIVLPGAVELGASIALNYAISLGPFERHTAPTSGAFAWRPDHSKLFSEQLATKSHFEGEAGGIRLANRSVGDDLQRLPPTHAPLLELKALRHKLANALTEIHDKTSNLSIHDLKRLLFRCAAALTSNPERDYDLLHHLVALPFETFTPVSISIGVEAWTWLLSKRPDMEIALMMEINVCWTGTVRRHRGLFSQSLNFADPFSHPIEYSPTDRETIERGLVAARRMLVPHSLLLSMLSSRFQAVRYRHPSLMHILLNLILRSCEARESFSTHALARETIFSLLVFGFEALKSSRLDTYSEHRMRESLYSAAFSWFAVRPNWSYGADRVRIDSDIKLLSSFVEAIQSDGTRADHMITSLNAERHLQRVADYFARQKSLNNLLRLQVENEISRLRVWSNPTNDPHRGGDHVVAAERSFTEASWQQVVCTAWKVNPAVAVHMAERFQAPAVTTEVVRLVRSHPQDVCHVPEAVRFFLGDRISSAIVPDLKHLLYWASLPPVLAITLFAPKYNNDPAVIQYAHHVLVQHPVDLTFFFVPQVVQALRSDALGYVERFIFETAKVSQLFCHQIIWNMKANCFKDDAGEIPDPMKPMLDRMVDMVVASLSGEARAFYDREFGFFNEVTSISGKLKPFIKKSKSEKKAKIDEEMAKIVVDPGVYLPSNPDGVVVELDKKSGRPLQSHAKAPFMATFKVQKERLEIATDPDSVLDESGMGLAKVTKYDVWQQAIFKVGDDCRQDVLALQIIAMFKNVFTSVGLMLYVFPYRVTATAPGCGVIDVVPNATSRDEMGRAKINDLLAFFVARYGNADTLEFQKARLNFIQSMAAYSVACYILQIKDRHNGNIMIDGQGHIVHVDFGFLFDIDDKLATLGVKFEPSSFKLNHEMVVLMGGRTSQGYALFVQLCVKAFLAIRPHAEQLIQSVHLMLGTDFPSFKGEPTIRRLRDRFALGLNERQAADFMIAVVRNAHENVRSTVYDEFQRRQNGIPYA
ncbi:phosphatidylinositol-4- kinase [Tulasnella sp. 331]|nr:phosphatidylinositol-4- kinase [Tulasnella sp. 331]